MRDASAAITDIQMQPEMKTFQGGKTKIHYGRLLHQYGIHVLATPKLRQADTSPRQATFFHFRTLQTVCQL